MTRQRNLIARFAPSVALGGLLAACGSAPPPAPVAQVPPLRPVPIDGTYGGLMTLARGDAINCGNQNEFTLQVENHGFSYQLAQPAVNWRPVIVFTGMIGADGTFNVASGADFMRGSVVGGHMQGEMAGDLCGFNFNADRGGTW